MRPQLYIWIHLLPSPTVYVWHQFVWRVFEFIWYIRAFHFFKGTLNNRGANTDFCWYYALAIGVKLFNLYISYPLFIAIIFWQHFHLIRSRSVQQDGLHCQVNFLCVCFSFSSNEFLSLVYYMYYSNRYETYFLYHMFRFW